MHFGDYQNEIYLAGLHGVLPTLPVDPATLESRGLQGLPQSLVSYVQGGCGDELTQRRNVEAFAHWGMIPRMLVETTSRDLHIDLFGMTLPSLIFMSPIGLAGLCAQDGHGDLAAARAAAAETGAGCMDNGFRLCRPMD
jgi:lactate 2-monooxygenase